jgi:hypothetical protein
LLNFSNTLSKAFLIGDITRSVSGIYNKVYSTQGQAILNYAEKHTFSHLALYVTLFGGDRSKLEKAIAYGMSKGVAIVVATIFPNLL